MDEKQTLAKMKFFFSYRKELRWLEEMSLQGWKFSEIKIPCRYIFVKCKPMRLLYEIDVFEIPMSPSLKQIQHKQTFVEMATETGWEVVCHDKIQTYYFCREYDPFDSSALYNDEESIRARAERFRHRFQYQRRFMLGIIIFFNPLMIIALLTSHLEGNGLIWFLAIYNLYFFLLFAYTSFYADYAYNELLTMGDREQECSEKTKQRTVIKLILTNRGLNRFLSKMSVQGWRLVKLTGFRYYFSKAEENSYVYAMDTKQLVNKRLILQGKKRLKDSEDIMGMNNDWQVISLHEAQEKGWQFVCALENRMMLYSCRDGEQLTYINPPEYDRRIRLISIIGDYSFLLLLCGLLGGLGGILVEMIFG